MARETYEQFVADREEDTFGGELVAVASPATKLVLAYLVLTLLVGGSVGLYLYSNPTLFGDQGYARLAGLVVLGLTFVGLIRLGIKYVVLMRTKYIVTPDSVRREYRLAYREQSRELPLHMIRGVELSRSRLQALLGYATISFLAVGSNRGIGYVEFDNAADPEKLQDAVLELLETQRENAAGQPASTPTASATPTASGSTDDASANSREDSATAGDAVQGMANDASTTDAGTNDPLADASNDENRRPVSGNDDRGRQPDAEN